jgi:NADH dehydrogenase
VAATRALLAAARRAGVRRVVQLSVTNAAGDSPFEYFRAKAAAEAALAESGLSFAVVRPTLVFGRGEVLVNNIAWLLRRLPLFVVPGSGRYRLQPVAAEDVAELCVQLGGRDDAATVDAAGPDVLTFDELVGLVRRAVGARSPVVHGPPRAALALASALGRLAGGTLLSAEELGALSAGLLTSAEPPLGTRRFGDWLEAAAPTLGARHATDARRPWA